MKDLELKRVKVLKAIKPICEAFNIKDYDYIVEETTQRETLVLNVTKIGCTWNSIDAIIEELIGYIFITKWCTNRSLGAFRTQTENRIKEYWEDDK